MAPGIFHSLPSPPLVQMLRLRFMGKGSGGVWDGTQLRNRWQDLVACLRGDAEQAGAEFRGAGSGSGRPRDPTSVGECSERGASSRSRMQERKWCFRKAEGLRFSLSLLKSINSVF